MKTVEQMREIEEYADALPFWVMTTYLKHFVSERGNVLFYKHTKKNMPSTR